MNYNNKKYKLLRNLYYNLYIQDCDNSERILKKQVLKAMNQRLKKYSSDFKYKDKVKTLRKYSK